MIPIIEMMSNSTRISSEFMIKILMDEDFVSYLKNTYKKDYDRASIDLCMAINQHIGSAVARPLSCDVIYVFNKEKLDSLLIEYNNDILDIYDRRFYGKDPQGVDLQATPDDEVDIEAPVDTSEEYPNLSEKITEVFRKLAFGDMEDLDE